MALLKNEKPCIKQDGATDESIDWLGALLAAASVASAGYNTYRAVDLATKEWFMADRYWRIADHWLDLYKDYYAPVEDQELRETRELPVEEPDYETARGRARAVAWIQFKDVIRSAIKCTSRYCTGLREDMLLDLTAAQANAVALADGLGYRNERAYVEARNGVRFERMMGTARRGRNMVSGSSSMASAAAGIYGSLFDQAWEGLVGAGTYLGYYTTRNQTTYPTTSLNTMVLTESRTASTNSRGEIVQGSSGGVTLPELGVSNPFRRDWLPQFSSGMSLNTSGGEG